MPRKVVPLVTNETYHVFNRGVDKRAIFLDKADYFRFHQSLQFFNTQDHVISIYVRSFQKDWTETQKPLVSIHGYCLLNNHFHLLLTQLTDGGISEFMKRLGGGYTSYFNERYERSGALFQGTFKRVHVGADEQLLHLAAYVNLNNKVHNYTDFSLNSFEVYTGTRDEQFVDTKLILEHFRSRSEFLTFAKETVAEIHKQRSIDEEYDKEVFLE